MNIQSSYYVFYDSTWLQITITAFGKIFSREEMLVDLAVFPEIRQIKLMICQTKLPRKNTSSPAKLNPVGKKNFHQLQSYSLFQNALQ